MPNIDSLRAEISELGLDPMLSEDAFQNEQSQKLFEAIDELRSSGIDGDIDLPELVIVGDQSSGKSSLLQTLTQIPFPVASRLCTRFPTRIISRRTPNAPETTRISIERHSASGCPPASDPDSKRAERYQRFTQTRSNITAEEFQHLMEEASEIMGVTGTVTSRAPSPPEHSPTPAGLESPEQAKRSTPRGKNFSRDVLKIEVSGPQRAYFSIVDCPGVFHTLTRGLTVDERRDVREMVSSYMRAKRSIIVCVANGLHDLANQVAFDMALSPDHDPKGEKTVGVITKCDATQHVDQIMELAMNREKYLHHGWFVVRNRTPAETLEGIDSHEQHVKETQFFATDPWAKLPESRRGSEALKRYLASLLCKHIQNAFPLLLKEIEARITSTTSMIRSLGSPRREHEEKRTYLANLAQDFHSIADRMVNGRYDSGGTCEMKLRMFVRFANEVFAYTMEDDGHAAPFAAIRSSQGEQATTGVDPTGHGVLSQPLASEIPAIADGLEQATSSSPPGSSKKRSGERKEGRSPLRVTTTTLITDPLTDLTKPVHSEIYDWIRQAIQENRGTELPGTLNSGILPALFRKQASKWHDIAETHFRTITDLAMRSVRAMLAAVCDDSLTLQKIGLALQRTNEEAKAKGFKDLSALTRDALHTPLQTSDSAFGDKVRQARLFRFYAAIERYAANNCNAQGELIVKSWDTEALFNEVHLSNARNLEDEIHDVLAAYYGLERVKFVENVNKIVVERYLYDPNGPVLSFSPMTVALFDREAVEELAAEDESLVAQRAREERTLARLVRAEEIANKYS